LRRGACWAGSRIVPFEQIGQSAKNRLWRQKVGTVSEISHAANEMETALRAIGSGR